MLLKKWVEDKWNEGVLRQVNNQTPVVELVHEYVFTQHLKEHVLKAK